MYPPSYTYEEFIWTKLSFAPSDILTKLRSDFCLRAMSRGFPMLRDDSMFEIEIDSVVPFVSSIVSGTGLPLRTYFVP